MRLLYVSIKLKSFFLTVENIADLKPSKVTG
jgi:hypothetical protein